MLRKGGGDGAERAAVIQDLDSGQQFARTLCKTLAPSALPLSGSLALRGVDADRPQLEAAPRMFSEPVNWSKSSDFNVFSVMPGLSKL